MALTGHQLLCKRPCRLESPTKGEQSINQSINRTINRTINQSIAQSIAQSINQSIAHSINQSINQSINRSINQSINRTSKCSFRVSIFPCTGTVFKHRSMAVWIKFRTWRRRIAFLSWTSLISPVEHVKISWKPKGKTAIKVERRWKTTRMCHRECLCLGHCKYPEQISKLPTPSLCWPVALRAATEKTKNWIK